MIAALVVSILVIAAQFAMLFWAEYRHESAVQRIQQRHIAEVERLTSAIVLQHNPTLRSVLPAQETDEEAVVRPLKPMGV